MYSRHHLVVSLVVVVPFLGWYDGPGGWPALLAWAAAVGVFVDLDHFLLARWRTGSWEPLRRCLVNPRLAFVDQDGIFDTGDVGSTARLVSHVLVGSVLCVGLAAVSQPMALVTAVVLGAHVAADVAWDVWTPDRVAASD